jgi:hypothetical protein
MQSSPASCHFLPLRSKYSPQRPVLKQPQSVFLPLGLETKFHTHTEQERTKLLSWSCHLAPMVNVSTVTKSSGGGGKMKVTIWGFSDSGGVDNRKKICWFLVYMTNI